MTIACERMLAVGFTAALALSGCTANQGVKPVPPGAAERMDSRSAPVARIAKGSRVYRIDMVVLQEGSQVVSVPPDRVKKNVNGGYEVSLAGEKLHFTSKAVVTHSTSTIYALPGHATPAMAQGRKPDYVVGL